MFNFIQKLFGTTQTTTIQTFEDVKGLILPVSYITRNHFNGSRVLLSQEKYKVYHLDC